MHPVFIPGAQGEKQRKLAKADQCYLGGCALKMHLQIRKPVQECRPGKNKRPDNTTPVYS
jgi:hypothetical protein